MTPISLRSKITRHTAITIALVGAVAIGALAAQSYLKSKVKLDAAVESLSRSAKFQANQLVPAFLVPEQRSGAALLLDRIKDDEHLESAVILNGAMDLPSDFFKCKLESAITHCIGDSENTLAVITPIAEYDRIFGFLFKSRKIEDLAPADQVLVLIEVVVGLLLLTFVILFGGMSRITAREVPRALEDLLNWLEQSLAGLSPERRPNLPFHEFNELAEKIANVIEERQKARDQIKLGQMASQVAHDIRSPLAALTAIESDLGALDEEKRLMVRSAVNRIRDIANNLLQNNRELVATGQDPGTEALPKQSASSQLLSSLIEPLISEKRLQFRSKIGIVIDGQLSPDSYGLFAAVQATEFKRVISNLINNAVEVLGDQGKVDISLHDGPENSILIRVTDNGRGIPPEILAKLGNRGETHGKEGGSGLGLYHARTKVESWGGKLKLESTVGVGTTVVIALPKVQAPDWFASKLEVKPDQAIVILDDDDSIHRIWQGRYDSLQVGKAGIKAHHFSTPQEFSTWVTSSPESRTAVYLMDYELLRVEETGLSLIEKHALGQQAILVTSRFEERAIQSQCKRLGIKLIPKGIAGMVPIQIVADLATYDAILLDDDRLVHMVWKAEARRCGKKLLTFSEPEAFFGELSKIDTNASIYIDSNLGDGVLGQDLVQRVAELGFTNIYLSTGYEVSSFGHIPGLKSVVGKDPPFAAASRR